MNTEIKKLIGEELKKYRNNCGINQEGLAQELGISRSTLSLIEKGELLPSTDILLTIIRKLKLDLQKLFEQGTKDRIVIDTNIILKRPQMIDRIIEDCYRVYIPETVIKELKKKKHDRHPAKRKLATLCENKINELVKADKIEIYWESSYELASDNDDSIFNATKAIARNYLGDSIYLLTNDIDFKLKNINSSNISIINEMEYEMKFKPDYINEFNVGKIDRFFELIKRNSYKDIINYDRSGINVNHCQLDGYTPLILAVRQTAKKKRGSNERKESEKILDFLVNLKGIDMNVPDETKFGFPPLTHAAQAGDVEIARMLIEHGADVNAPSVNSKNALNTPVMVAAWHGNKEMVELLVENGACINQQDKGNGFTPLIKAVFSKNEDVVKYLLEKNADTAIMSHERKTALDYAYEKKLKNIIEILKEENEND